ncbi:nicotinate phosphoribosyltransferase [Endozoicomonas arenosclerae]|uniref:nicotinate phosphoribosyltransferase n=1 Tax=Endozoicomonas arenosclerae TaxID=1633495 RepID=UPI000786321A|nr:nicotinate phosphoribosyltransferase [Endozoicomonas arenosclerae]
MEVQQPIITSLLDTDLYKYTMQQAMVLRYPEAEAKMAFRCRSGQLNVSLADLRREVDALQHLRLKDDELNWLASLPFIKSEFIAWLKDFSLDPSQVVIAQSGEELSIEVTGNWAEITHFEIFILAIVSELHSQSYLSRSSEHEGKERLEAKIHFLKRELFNSKKGFGLVDFGTRRRCSRSWQTYVVQKLMTELDCFDGTSNLHLARTLGLKPVGTMAHEWLQAHQSLSSILLNSQKEALQVWLDEYGNQLGVALTDTISMNAFLADLDETLAKAYSGLRHDSGDPIEWGELALAHYEKLGIDPRSKKFVFSDKLDFQTAIDIYQHFKGRVNVSFGIGTYLTNDLGFPAPNIVLKLVEVNGQPVAKLSDNPEKIMCQDPDYVRQLKAVFS